VVGKVAAGTLDLDHILAERDKSPPEDMLQWLEVDILGRPTEDKPVEVAEGVGDKPGRYMELRHMSVAVYNQGVEDSV
jgi:hypothetical protein